VGCHKATRKHMPSVFVRTVSLVLSFLTLCTLAWVLRQYTLCSSSWARIRAVIELTDEEDMREQVVLALQAWMEGRWW
jgi:hypothetical protein